MWQNTIIDNMVNNFKINNSEIVPVDKTNATVIAYTNKIHDKTF